MRPRIVREELRSLVGLPRYLGAGDTGRWPQVRIPLRTWSRGEEVNTLVADVVLRPRPGGTRKSSAHRLWVVCPLCRREIPAGRWHQHDGGRDHKAAEVKDVAGGSN